MPVYLQHTLMYTYYIYVQSLQAAQSDTVQKFVCYDVKVLLL